MSLKRFNYSFIISEYLRWKYYGYADTLFFSYNASDIILMSKYRMIYPSTRTKSFLDTYVSLIGGGNFVS